MMISGRSMSLGAFAEHMIESKKDTRQLRKVNGESRVTSKTIEADTMRRNAMMRRAMAAAQIGVKIASQVATAGAGGGLASKLVDEAVGKTIDQALKRGIDQVLEVQLSNGMKVGDVMPEGSLEQAFESGQLEGGRAADFIRTHGEFRKDPVNPLFGEDRSQSALSYQIDHRRRSELNEAFESGDRGRILNMELTDDLEVSDVISEGDLDDLLSDEMQPGEALDAVLAQPGPNLTEGLVARLRNHIPGVRALDGAMTEFDNWKRDAVPLMRDIPDGPSAGLNLSDPLGSARRLGTLAQGATPAELLTESHALASQLVEKGLQENEKIAASKRGIQAAHDRLERALRADAQAIDQTLEQIVQILEGRIKAKALG